MTDSPSPGQPPGAAEVVKTGSKPEGTHVQAEIDALRARVEAAEAKTKSREVEVSELQDENRRLYGIVKETAAAAAKPQKAKRAWGLILDE